MEQENNEQKMMEMTINITISASKHLLAERAHIYRYGNVITDPHPVALQQICNKAGRQHKGDGSPSLVSYMPLSACNLCVDGREGVTCHDRWVAKSQGASKSKKSVSKPDAQGQRYRTKCLHAVLPCSWLRLLSLGLSLEHRRKRQTPREISQCFCYQVRIRKCKSGM